MYAVIKTGGKQYKVAKEDVILVEKLSAQPGEQVLFDEVLMVAGDAGPTVGAPHVAGASVAAEVVEQERTKKIIVFKKKRRQNYRRRAGHRQNVTRLRITDILTDGQTAPAQQAAAAEGGLSTESGPAAAPERNEE